MKPLSRLPAYAVNGIAVATGIGLIQLLIGSLAGPHAAQLALSGAVCASLADVANTSSRTLHRVAAAAALALLAAVVVALLKPHPIALGIGVSGITFVAMMTMSWGARAGAVSFAPILSLVFSMAVPDSAASLATVVGWNAVGGAAYLAWALLMSQVFERRYTTLALVSTLHATAQLLRLRAALLESPPAQTADADAMREWIKGEAELAERMQTARDFVFAQVDTDRARRDTAILLHAIDLRDVLLASRLDLDLLGSDATGRWILGRIARSLREIGDVLDASADALRDGELPASAATSQFDMSQLFADAPIAHHDARTRLLPAVIDRLRSIAGDATSILAMLRGAREEVPLSREQLRRFVAPEGWPLKALKAQMSLQSPVLRHALRAALALGAAYFLALALPWASHPHWLVLSVAVVLRGNLEQTLTRRNARVLGTMLGCGVVLVLSGISSAPALGLIFLGAVGIAHSFVMQRYWLTATAATVMALLQSHMVDPAGGFAIAERVADTVLGAALAWAFSYVLPSWERRSLPRAIERVLKELRDYASHALRMQPADAVEQRLARRRAYDALSAMAATLQRSTAEPKSVQVPIREVAGLLDHGQRLMAHLSMVRMMLTRRSSDLSAAVAGAALDEAGAALSTLLRLEESDSNAPSKLEESTQEGGDPEELSLLPMQAPADDVTPWLLRRLQVLVHDGRQIRRAASGALRAS